MPKARTIKVYRTPIGFHDAFVAAPSQKAALEAWGSDANLFARGIAEQITDPALTEAPLANPGKVIKRLRGTVEEQIAALPKGDADKPKRRAVTKQPRPFPRPSRDPLAAAEQALAAAEDRHQEELKNIQDRERQLAAERRAIEARQAREIVTLERKLSRAREQYDAVMRKWQG